MHSHRIAPISRALLPRTLVRALLVLLATAWVASPRVAMAADGDLDPTFHFDGIATLQIGPNGQNFGDLATQPDGKIVAVGHTSQTGDFQIARYNTDGSLDTSFGSGGVVVTDFGADSAATRVRILADGRILVAGSRWEYFYGIGNVSDFALARYNANGSLDTSFGNGGKVWTNLHPDGPTNRYSNDMINGIEIQSDGKIVAAGITRFGTYFDSFRHGPALARYLPNGTLDSSFGASGIVRLDPGCCYKVQEFHSVALQPDGRIVATGYHHDGSGSPHVSGWLVRRFLANGAPDTSFGYLGVVKQPDLGSCTYSEDLIGVAIRVLDGGSLLVGGTCRHSFALARYTPAGQLDPSFGANGLSIYGPFNTSHAYDMAIQSDGRILLAGTFYDMPGGASRDIGIARFLPNGSLDTSFGTLGRVRTYAGQSVSEAFALNLQADGKILLAGRVGVSALVARYRSTPPNTPPVASAGPDQVVPESSLVTLDGSGSYDPDGQALTYQWTQTSGPPVTLDLTDPVHPTFIAPPVPPIGGLVVFELVVSDPQAATASDAVEIEITNVNAPPQADAGDDQIVAEGAGVVLDGSGSLDQDGDAFSYAWVQTAGPPVTLTGAGTAQPSFTAPQVGVAGVTLGFELTVDDGQAAASDAVSVFVTNLNLAPTANAGPDQAVDEQTAVTLDGTASSDPDDDALSYEWSQVGGPSVVLSSNTSSGPSFMAPSVPASGATLSFQLVVRDGSLPSEAPDYVDVTVKNMNHPPVADAGDDQTLAEASPVTLDASESYDVDGETLSFSWAQVSGSGVVLAGGATATPSFTAPLVGASGETLTFEVVVGDGIDTATDRLGVVVENVNHAPSADAGPDQTVDEGSTVSLDGTGSDDPDADPLAYQWSQVSGPAVTLSSDTSPSPTFGAPQAGAGGAQLGFQLVVNDGLAASEPDGVVITVQNVNDLPLCDSAQPSVGVLWPPNHKLVAVGITGLSDPNADDLIVTVTGVTQDEPGNGLGDGDSSPDAVLGSGNVMLRAERSGLGNGRVYRVQFTASDGAGSCSGSVSVCVPHDRKGSCTDSGQAYGSTAP